MKNLLLFIAMCCSTFFAVAQDLPDFSKIDVTTEKGFSARTDDAALKAATYLLSLTPDRTESEQGRKAGAFLMTWMTNSPDYTFAVDGTVKLTEGNPNLMVVMMAAMAQYVLTHKEDKDDMEKIRLNTVKKLVAYANNPANNVVPNDALAEAIKAEKQGKLDQYLNNFNE